MARHDHRPAAIAIVLLILGFLAPYLIAAEPSLDVQEDAINPPTLPGLRAYNVFVRTASSSSADWLGAFDLTVVGSVHQTWAYDADSGEYTRATPLEQDLLIGSGRYANDTHWALLGDQILYVGSLPPAETNDISGGNGHGWGTLDRTAIGILSSYRSEVTHLARIVVSDGGWVRLVGEIADDSGYEYDTNLVVPEPAVGVVFCLGILAAKRPRRIATR